jgi:CPA2 family monovalent cation:H+ antiporter-2
MTIPLLNDLLIIFALSIAVLYVCHRLRVPAIVGFLLTGIVAGPFGFGLVGEVHEVEILAEIGVIMLLFTIGMEFSLGNLIRIKRAVILGGLLQVLFTISLVTALMWIFKKSFGEAIFGGFLVSLSSTAIVLKLLQERAELDSPHGQLSLAILIFQDIAVVPMILVTPLLANASGGTNPSIWMFVLKAAGVVALAFVGSKWLVPGILFQVAKTRSRELFLLCIVAMCLSAAWLTSSAGLSLALGAFVAGLIISESEYSHQAIGDILPFRDVFISLFFVSIGMLLNTGQFLARPVLIFLIVLGLLLLKSLLTIAVGLILRYPLRTAILAGFALCQIGEFSFILSETGLTHDLLDAQAYQLFLVCAILTMAATPLMMAVAPRLAERCLRLPMPALLKSGQRLDPSGPEERKKDHLVMIGFGVTGHNLARAARAARISYIIIEMNPETVRTERARGEPIRYGDASHAAVLEAADFAEARVAVLAINDPAAARRIVESCRKVNPGIHLIVRTRYVLEMEPLYRLGANEVITEEFETAVEIFARVLRRYLAPRDLIDRLIGEARASGYEMLRGVSPGQSGLGDLAMNIPDLEIASVRLEAASPLAGMSLAQTNMRKKYGVTVIAIRKGPELITNPDGDLQLSAEDILILMGKPDQVSNIALSLNPP